MANTDRNSFVSIHFCRLRPLADAFDEKMNRTTDTPECGSGRRGASLVRRAGYAIAVLVVVLVAIAFGFTSPARDWQRWGFFAILGLLAGAGILGFQRARVARLLELERVRTRIATDLHDDIGSSLTQIAILSEIARSRACGGDPLLAEHLEKIAATSRELVDSMSDVVWAINPMEDQLSDLAQRIRRFGTDMADSRDVHFRFRPCGSDQSVVLDADERREAYLVFKESLNNAIKHSGCRSVETDLAVDDGWLTLRVHDDGHGFDTTAGSDGHGLASMRARARAVGGSFSVVSSADTGTTETLRMPLGRRKRFSLPRWTLGLKEAGRPC